MPSEGRRSSLVGVFVQTVQFLHDCVDILSVVRAEGRLLLVVVCFLVRLCFGLRGPVLAPPHFASLQRTLWESRIERRLWDWRRRGGNGPAQRTHGVEY